MVAMIEAGDLPTSSDGEAEPRRQAGMAHHTDSYVEFPFFAVVVGEP